LVTWDRTLSMPEAPIIEMGQHWLLKIGNDNYTCNLFLFITYNLIYSHIFSYIQTHTMKKKLYKSIIQIEVLSEEPINGMSLTSIIDEGDTGSFSIKTKDIKIDKEIKGIRAVREMKLHGSDVEFFQMDEKGNDISEDND